MSLSDQNRALIERVEPKYFGWQRAPDAILNRFLDAARAEGAPAGEPVAWRRRLIGDDGSWLLFDVPEDVAFYTEIGRYDVEPLYATPAQGVGTQGQGDEPFIIRSYLPAAPREAG